LTIVGVIQDMYIRDHIFSGPNLTTQMTLVGSISQGIVNFGVLISSLLLDRLGGTRNLCILGSCFIFGGFMLTSISTSIWQIYLSLSIGASFGAALLFGVTTLCIPHWFEKKRATAFGIQSSATQFSSLVLPFIVTRVYDTLGHQWVFRVLAFISVAINAIAIAFMKDQPTRMENSSGEQISGSNKNKTMSFDLSIFKITDMLIWLPTYPMSMSSRFIVLMFLPNYGTYIGLSGTKVAAVTAIASAMSLFGRISLGIMADRFGYLNIYTLSNAMTTLTILTMWMFANNFASLIGFSVVYGFFCATQATVHPAVTARIVGMERYPAAMSFSMVLSILVIPLSLIANSLSAGIGTAKDPFLIYKLSGGALSGLCTILGLVTKFRLDRNLFANV
ncbi:major facilitator superfamily domain-containing protein, partial [Zychaea mexicana]|uniref:major facilitator superfamily domain-containing protein n=1 Tax=Zychaea mexicana TaxID=64656 RepID=UPI0022FEB83C